MSCPLSQWRRFHLNLSLTGTRPVLNLCHVRPGQWKKRGTKRVELLGANDKRQITAIFCGSLLGDFLLLQIIYKGKTTRCHPAYDFPSEWNVTHSPNHWSTEETMLEYISEIIVPYVKTVRHDIGQESAALVVLDNFKGQVTSTVTRFVENHNIHTCPLPANTTDLLQPMDIAVNKPVKSFLHCFREWYTEQVMKQLDGKDMDELESAKIEPIDLSMQAIKHISAKWLVDMAKYISNNPRFIVNGFQKSGITGAIDGVMEDTTEDDNSNLTEGDDTEDAESGGEFDFESDNEYDDSTI